MAWLVTNIPVAQFRKLFEDLCDEPRVHLMARVHFQARVHSEACDHCYTRVLCSLSAHRHFQQTTNPDLGQSEEANLTF